MTWRRVRAVARKEFLHIVRDTRSLLLALLLPFIMLLAFGWALSLDVDRIPTVLYDQDKTPESRDLVRQFTGSLTVASLVGFVSLGGIAVAIWNRRTCGLQRGSASKSRAR